MELVELVVRRNWRGEIQFHRAWRVLEGRLHCRCGAPAWNRLRIPVTRRDWKQLQDRCPICSEDEP